VRRFAAQVGDRCQRRGRGLGQFTDAHAQARLQRLTGTLELQTGKERLVGLLRSASHTAAHHADGAKRMPRSSPVAFASLPIAA
jgi:hypothetical protein